MLTSLDGHELDLGTDEIDVGREEVETGQGGMNDSLAGRLASQQRMVDGRVKTLFLDSKTCGGIALGVEIS
jgi:hypothetical protein